MSMETAIKVMGESTVPQGTPSTEIPINMANTGANEQAPIQAAQEPKETAITSPQVNEEAKIVSAETKQGTDSKKEEPIAAKFSALAKKEKALVKLQADAKAREAMATAKEADVAAREAKIKESEALWETNVFEALRSKGYSYQQLTDMILSGQAAPEKKPEDPIEKTQKSIEALRKEFTDKEAAREAAVKKAQEDATAAKAQSLKEAEENYMAEVNEFSKANAETYELLNTYGQQELVIETVKGFYDTHKRVLSVKEACDMVEQYLDSEAQKALKTKKYASKLAAPAIPTEEKKEEEPRIQTKTLSNNLTPTMNGNLPAKTEAERIKRAMAALNNQR